MPDPGQIASRVQEELAAFHSSHDQVVATLAVLETMLTNQQQIAFADVREAYLAAYRDQRLMGALLEEVAEYLKVLIAQRQSAREMFFQGGEAVIADLLVLATGPEFALLRRLLAEFSPKNQVEF